MKLFSSFSSFKGKSLGLNYLNVSFKKYLCASLLKTSLNGYGILGVIHTPKVLWM